MNMNNIEARTLEVVHTHTHTHTGRLEVYLLWNKKIYGAHVVKHVFF